MTPAYTIGNQKSYDLALADTETPTFKWGVHPEEDPPYEGGWVWRTAQEAQDFLSTQGGNLGFVGSVYELALPTDWATDASVEPHPKDGVHRLLHDACIMRKVVMHT